MSRGGKGNVSLENGVVIFRGIYPVELTSPTFSNWVSAQIGMAAILQFDGEDGE